MNGINVDFSGLKNFVSDYELEQFNYKIKNAHDLINNRNGEGSNMLGWLEIAH